MKIETKPVSAFKPGENIRADLGTEAELRQFGESLKKRQIHPLLAQPDGTVIAGRRRWATVDSVGPDPGSKARR